MTSAPGVATAPADLCFRTTSASATRAFAAWLAGVARAGDRIGLIGPLGAGKTQFAKGFAVGLGVGDIVNSPSFTLMAEYLGRLPLFHQDLYRLEGAGEAYDGGLLDERQDAGVTISEWADRLGPDLDPVRLEVWITPHEADAAERPAQPRGGDDQWAPTIGAMDADSADEGARTIELRASEGYERYLDRARSWTAGEG